MRKLYFFEPTSDCTYEDVISRPIGGSEFQIYNLVNELSKYFQCFVFNHCKEEKKIRNVFYNHYSQLFDKRFIDDTVIIVCHRRPEPKIREMYKKNKMILYVHDLENMLSNYRDFIFEDKNLHLACNSEFSRDFVIPREVGNVEHNRLHITYNIFYPLLFTKSNPIINKHQLIYASAWQKGVEKIIRIFDYILTRNKDFKLVLLSPGYDWNNFEKYREELATKYGDSIKILGPQKKDNYVKLLEESLCVFAPDFGETFGCVFEEASYLGTPTIGSINSGAVREIVGDVFMVNYNNMEEVYQLLEKIYNNRPTITLDEKFMLKQNLIKWLDILEYK